MTPKVTSPSTLTNRVTSPFKRQTHREPGISSTFPYPISPPISSLRFPSVQDPVARERWYNWLRSRPYDTTSLLTIIREGVKLPLPRFLPRQIQPSYRPHFNPAQRSAFPDMIQSMLQQELIVPIKRTAARAISPIFLTPKKGGWRFVFDAKRLNSVLGKPSHFSLPSPFRSPDISVGGSSHGVVIDLQSGFSSVRVHSSAIPWLAFADPLSGCTYALQVLPQGLHLSPSIFCSLTSEMNAYIKETFQDVSAADVYVDDFIITSSRPSNDLLSSIIKHIEFFGFTVSRTKLGVWATKLVWLGLSLDLHNNMIAVTEGRLLSIKRHYRKLTRTLSVSSSIPVRDLASFLGKITFISPLLKGVKWHVNHLSRALAHVTRRSGWGCDAHLSSLDMRELHLIGSCLEFPNTVHIVKAPIAATLTTDASPYGMGSVLDFPDQPLQELSLPWTEWSVQDRRHISLLETLALRRSLEHWRPQLAHKHILWQSDSISALSWIRKLSSPPRAEALVRSVMTQMTRSSTIISGTHLPGHLNQHADQLSRQGQLPPLDDFRIPPRLLRELMQKYHIDPERSVEVFSHRTTTTLPRFRERHGQSALTHPWSSSLQAPAWLFPPPALIPRVLDLLRSTRVHGVLVIPQWRSRQWLKPLLAMRTGPVTQVSPREFLLPSCTKQNPFRNHRSFLCFPFSS